MISVLIASMGRPHLARTLDSIAAARLPEGETLEVIVADDSAHAKALTLIAGLKSPLAIRVLPVASGNVSTARNACLDAASGDFLIFVDDDETVEPGWLEGHLSAARDFAADAVFGPVFPLYPAGTPAWFIAANPLFGDWGWQDDGKAIAKGRTGNTLIRRAALGALRFDPAFGRMGGEDDDFFLRFAARGNRMVVTDRARAHEMVPEDRANAGYALGRADRTGQIYSRLRTREKGILHKAGFAIGAAAKALIAGAASAISRPFDRTRSLRLAMKAHNNLGKIKGLWRRQSEAAWR